MAQIGGTIVCGGDQPDFKGSELEGGYYVNPTIIAGLHPHTSRCQQEEIFGPVVTVYPFSDEIQLLQYVNQVAYGLSSSLWTSNINRANRLALKIQAGTVWVNCWLVVSYSFFKNT